MFDIATLHAVYKEVAPLSADLPMPDRWKLAGEGLWGQVYDLGDGSMLKLVRRQGGLGNGEALHHREVSALTFLSGMRSAYMRIPQFLGGETFNNPYIGSAPPMAGWLRIETLSGTRLTVDRALTMPAQTRQILGERIGAAIADFNNEATKLALAADIKLADTITRSLALARAQLGSPELHRAADLIGAAWEVARARGPLVFVHGDINLGNLVDHGEKEPLGLVDFAESGWSLAATEFRHFEPLGALRDAAFRGFATREGAPPDLGDYYLASAANALMTIAITGNAGHPRDQMRRSGLLRHCLHEAGLEL
tara:strand:- start:202117 stop:203046 length:930 start_codon:yes stop_codon:yes gene_type:complete